MSIYYLYVATLTRQSIASLLLLRGKFRMEGWASSIVETTELLLSIYSSLGKSLTRYVIILQR